MSIPNLSEESFYFYIADNVRDNLTDLIVSIVEDYGNPELLQEALWHQRFFGDVERSKNIKSFWSVSQDLAAHLDRNDKLLSSFHGLQVWACEEDSIEDALRFLQDPNNLPAPSWST